MDYDTKQKRDTLQKQQSLLLVDKQRVSVLYIPTGKTKHKIPQLSGVVTSAACVNATPGGESCHLSLK